MKCKITLQVLSDRDKKAKYDLYGPNLRPDGASRYRWNDSDDDSSEDDYSEDEDHYRSFFDMFFGGFYFHFSSHSPPNPGHSRCYSTRYDRQYSSDFETKEKKKRETNVKSTFTTKGSRDDDYDIDMVLKKLGETEVNSSKKKSKK